MVATGAVPRRDDEIEAELRRVSLLFADIQGSTTLVRNLDPEDAASLLGPAIRIMSEEVNRFDGVVRDLGDGIMAVFGAPSACEDHTLRACLAAIAIRNRFSSQSSPPVRVRMGIHYGEVFLRHSQGGKGQMHDIFGVTVHVAARLEQTAEPGTVCLSSAAYELVRGFVHAESLPPIGVKGLEQPVERLLLLDADQTANRWRVRADRGLTRIADRREEMKTLAQALANIDRSGLQLIQVSGPAGIGKSRLIHEFLANEAARRCHVVRFIGDPHRKYSAYHPISTWLGTLLDIRSSDSTRDAQYNLRRTLRQLNIDDEDQWRALETMLGLEPRADRTLVRFDDQTRTLDIANAIAAIISKTSAGNPVIVVCEDIDCFDPASQELIASISENFTERNMLLLTTSRTRFRAHHIRAAEARLLALSPLPDADAKQLLASLHPEFHTESGLTATILQKAGGNALFLEEVAPLVMAKSAGAKNTIKTLALLGQEAASAIPDRVEALIADNLAHLPRDQRRLVQACAVIGADVPLRLASKLTGIPDAEVYARLVKLRSRQLLYETRKYPDPQFSFKHALTRDVAYHAIPRSKRREYHNKIVDILEREPVETRDRYLDDLCIHTIHAQAWPKAIEYLQLAANLAIEKGTYEVAESYLNRALEISRSLPDDPETFRSRIEILLGLRSLVGANGKYLEVNGLLDEAEKLADQLGDLAAQSKILAHRAHVLNTLGDLGTAVTLAERSRGLAQILEDAPLRLLATFFLGQAHFNLGNFDAAEQAFSENLALMRDVPVPVPIGGLGTVSILTYVTRAAARAFKADFPAAANDVEEAKQLAIKTQRPYDLSFAWFGDGFLHLQQREAHGAIAGFQQSMASAESGGKKEQGLASASLRSAGVHEISKIEKANSAIQRVQVGLGHALLIRSEPENAMPWLSRAHQVCREHNRYMIQIWAGTGLALACFQTGSDDLAYQYAHEAAEMGLRFGFHCFRVQALRVRGLVRASRPRTVAAGVEDLLAALALAKALGMQAEMAHCHAALAWSHADDEREHVKEARRLYGQLEMSGWCEQVLSVDEADRKIYF